MDFYGISSNANIFDNKTLIIITFFIYHLSIIFKFYIFLLINRSGGRWPPLLEINSQQQLRFLTIDRSGGRWPPLIEINSQQQLRFLTIDRSGFSYEKSYLT